MQEIDARNCKKLQEIAIGVANEIRHPASLDWTDLGFAHGKLRPLSAHGYLSKLVAR
jgi:hypothetical protein